MEDQTEGIRRGLVDAINFAPGSREALEEINGKVWDTTELTKEFEVDGFMAPHVVVVNKLTGEKGTMVFQDYPRFYFSLTKAA